LEITFGAEGYEFKLRQHLTADWFFADEQALFRGVQCEFCSWLVANIRASSILVLVITLVYLTKQIILCDK
jgi:hypothetical protein